MTTEFPNKNLKTLICNMFTTIPSIELKLEAIFPEKTWSYDGSDQGEDWIFVFKKDNSINKIKISLYLPDNFIHISFTRNELWFSFENYLSFIGKRYEYDNIDAKTIEDKQNFSGYDGLIEQLKLFYKYLLSDLAKVARGEEWKEIPIDYMGYK